MTSLWTSVTLGFILCGLQVPQEGKLTFKLNGN